MTKEYVADNVPQAIESGIPIYQQELWGGEKTQADGTFTFGLYAAPEIWFHLLEALHITGQQQLPNSPIYRILEEAIANRFGIERKEL